MFTNQDFTHDRTKYIGGSDIGPILGLSPYRSAVDVWMEKTGKAVKHPDSLPLRFGSFAEEFVANEYARATGFYLRHDESLYIHPTYRFMAGHIDRLVLGDGLEKPPTKILECKTANPFSRGQWGEPGSDQVPMQYLAQCAWYLAVTGINKIDLAVLFLNTDFRIYHIERDLELENLILERAIHFWHEHVLKDIPPPVQSEADCQLLFSKGQAQHSVEANSQTVDLVRRFHHLSQQSEVCEEELSSIKTQIMAQMQDAEILTHQGSVLATWKAPKPSYRIDTKRLQSEEAAIFDQYKVMNQASRRLVIKVVSEESPTIKTLETA